MIAAPRAVAPQGAVLLLLGLVLIGTGRSVANDFTFDDVPIVVENTQVHDFSPPWVYAQQSYWPPKNLGDAYRPWTIWAFAVQWWASGGAPVVFHAVNLALTAAVTLAVLALGLEWTTPGGAVAAAAIFAVHPVHVEATGNVVGQAELWMALFSVAAVVLYLRARRTDTLDGPTRLTLAVLLVLAAASKEQGIVLPGLLLLAEWLQPGRTPGRPPRTVWATFGLLALVAVGFLAGRFAVLGDLGGGPPAAGLEGQNLRGRFLVMLPIMAHWARLLLWPAALSAQYSPPAFGRTDDPLAIAGGGATLVAVVLFAIWAFRRQRAAAFGVMWAAVTLAPVSNIPFPTGVLLAERTLFLPSVGIVLAGGALLAEWGSRPRTGFLAAAVGLAVIGLGAARSFSRQAVWRNGPTLFYQTIADTPTGYRGYFVLGRELVRRGFPDRAALMFQQAAALYPKDQRIFEEWGQILRVQNRCDLAAPIFERGVRAEPRGTLARSRLFECLMVLHRYEDALRVAEAGVALGSTEFAAAVVRATKARDGAR